MQYYPKMCGGFMKFYPGNNEVQFVQPEREIYFQDPVTYELMMMATSSAC